MYVDLLQPIFMCLLRQRPLVVVVIIMSTKEEVRSSIKSLGTKTTGLVKEKLTRGPGVI